MAVKVIIYICIGILAYLLGSVSSSIIFGKLRFKKDVRAQGSGNAGATNVARVFGLKFGFLVLFLDVAKAAIATLGGYYIILLIPVRSGHRTFSTNRKMRCGLLLCSGTLFPALLQIQGRKGDLRRACRCDSG